MALEAGGMWMGPGMRIAAGAALAALLGGCRSDTLVAPKLPTGWAKNYPQSAYLLKQEVESWQKMPWAFALS